MQSDHIILARRPDLMSINKKKNLLSSRFCRSDEPLSENKRKRKLGFCQRTKNGVKHEGDIVVGALGTVLKGLEKSL